MSQKEKPFVINLDNTADRPHPADVEIKDRYDAPLTASPPGNRGIWGWVFTIFFSLLTAMISIWVWDFTLGLIARNTVLGWIFAALVGAAVFAVFMGLLSEIRSIRKLKNIDALKMSARTARQSNDTKTASQIITKLAALYRGRPELATSLRELEHITADEPDAFAKLNIAETHVLQHLDTQAVQEIETAARQVATVTALMPIAAVDVVSALVINIRMIRKIGHIYGGRSGFISAISLLRKVMAHLVATGALAIGDDWLGSVFGGSIMAKLSRRFGEGMINAALTARVGKSAIEACRPLDFHHASAPQLRTIMARALAGVFDKKAD